MANIAHVSPLAEEIAASLSKVVQGDPRMVGLTLGGSAVVGGMDEFSDLDFVVICDDAAASEVLADAPAIAARLGPLLAAFTGEHVGEPRLLIALYGPPLLHVDLKFIGLTDLTSRVEDGLILWERDGAITAATPATEATWPQPNLQWIEDRFWIWIHYGATKLGRGELFECLDLLSFLRAAVFGPMLAVQHDARPQGVRRVEIFAADAVPALSRTVAAYSAASCASALEAAVDLYRGLRDQAVTEGVVQRAEAEVAAVAYLATVAHSLRSGPAGGS